MTSLRRILSDLVSLRWMRSSMGRTLRWESHVRTGMTSFQAGRLEEAEAEYSAALREAEWFAEGDIRLSVSLDNLAALYRMRGKYREAEPLCLRTLAVKERAFGPASANVASTLKDLVEIDRALGRPEEAEAYNARALAILESAIGPDFPELSDSLARSPVLGRKIDP